MYGVVKLLSLSVCFWAGIGDWSDVEIQQLREGMRAHGRMWSKVSRYVGTNKTAGHCKSFFQEYQSNQRLQLGQALEEHVRNKVRWDTSYMSTFSSSSPTLGLDIATCNSFDTHKETAHRLCPMCGGKGVCTV